MMWERLHERGSGEDMGRGVMAFASSFLEPDTYPPSKVSFTISASLFGVVVILDKKPEVP